MTSRTRNQQNMNKLFFFSLVFLITLDKCLSEKTIQCYKCAVSLETFWKDNRSIPTPICSKFDKSEKYIVNCPYSTMCQRTISTLHLQNDQKLDTFTMGCAQQKNTTQVYDNARRNWGPKYIVEDVYHEGCFEITGYAGATTTTTHCYCRGDLCNSSNIVTIRKSIWTGILALYLWRWMTD